MTPEYLVLGIILIVMGAIQAWLRHGPGGKALRRESGAEPSPERGLRSGRAWEGWTAILGGVGVVFGVVLVVLGVLGR